MTSNSFPRDLLPALETQRGGYLPVSQPSRCTNTVPAVNPGVCPVGTAPASKGVGGFSENAHG